MHSRYLLNSIVITDSCSNWKCKLIIVRVEGAKGLTGLIYLSMCNFFSRVHYRVKNILTNSPNRFATDCKSVYVRSVFVWFYCFCLVMCVRVRVWNNMYFLYPHVFFSIYMYTKIYARKHNRKTTVCPRRMKFVFTCSRLQHDGRKQLLAVTTPCSGTQTYLYTIYLVVCIHAERLNPLWYYYKLHCLIFLSFLTRSFVIRKVRIVVTKEQE